jgi:energy-coupling factor transport system ATP-binding protein
VSLAIEDGEFVAIMGQNGAGKTTLVKHFNGLLKPNKGRVLVDDQETTKTTVAKLARDVGFVFQNPDHQLFSEDVIEKRINWALNLLGLSEYRKTSPFMLSGGERKRVALASVLAWDPRILILDEPTIGQDYEQKEKLRQFILQMKSQQRTIVMVTHDVEFVAECNPRVLLMLDGQIIADGEAGKILTDPVVLERASIVPPQIAQIFLNLPGFELPKNVIEVYDAQRILLDFVEKRKR